MYICSDCGTPLLAYRDKNDMPDFIWQCKCDNKGAHIVAQATSKLAGVGGIKS